MLHSRRAVARFHVLKPDHAFRRGQHFCRGSRVGAGPEVPEGRKTDRLSRALLENDRALETLARVERGDDHLFFWMTIDHGWETHPLPLLKEVLRDVGHRIRRGEI